MTSSRRALLKSMSTSGYVVRPSLMKRSKSSRCRMGATRGVPSTYATLESPPGRARRRVRPPTSRGRRRQRQQLGGRLEVRLTVRPAHVGERVERPAVADGGQHVLHLAPVGGGVVGVVRGG